MRTPKQDLPHLIETVCANRPIGGLFLWVSSSQEPTRWGPDYKLVGLCILPLWALFGVPKKRHTMPYYDRFYFSLGPLISGNRFISLLRWPLRKQRPELWLHRHRPRPALSLETATGLRGRWSRADFGFAVIMRIVYIYRYARVYASIYACISMALESGDTRIALRYLAQVPRRAEVFSLLQGAHPRELSLEARPH